MSRYALLWENGKNNVLHSALVVELCTSPTIAAPAGRRGQRPERRRAVHKERLEALDPLPPGLLGPDPSARAWTRAWERALLELGCPPHELCGTTCALGPAHRRPAPMPPALDITELLQAAQPAA